MVRFDPDRHHRRSIRLRGYDYAQPGTYYVTICTHNRELLLGTVFNGEVTLSASGAIVQSCWQELPGHYHNVTLDAFVIMPNHVHAVLMMSDGSPSRVGAGFKPAPTPPRPLSEVVRGFKTFTARRINQLRKTPGEPVWQRNYFEHIVRNDADLDRIRRYIDSNPAAWESDEYYT